MSMSNSIINMQVLAAMRRIEHQLATVLDELSRVTSTLQEGIRVVVAVDSTDDSSEHTSDDNGSTEGH